MFVEEKCRSVEELQFRRSQEKEEDILEAYILLKPNKIQQKQLQQNKAIFFIVSITFFLSPY